MERIAFQHLLSWKQQSNRKPLLIRGARQVGKTHLVRQLGMTFENFVEINLEFLEEARRIFEVDLDPVRICRELSLVAQKQIEPSKTLLFIDEIQSAPRAIIALRYFYEILPQLHVIAAGSLLDFAILEVGMPVGRVDSLYLYPMSFFEFLIAYQQPLLAKEILLHEANKEMPEVIHQKLQGRLAEYFASGGMPAAVKSWIEDQDPLKCFQIHQTLIETYRQDFNKYAKRSQIRYLESIFNAVPRSLAKRFKYSSIHGDYRKRELAPAVDLLVTAGIVHRIFHSDGQGIPLMAQIDPECFKLSFLDIALAQTVLGGDLSAWILPKGTSEFINKGDITEAFVGQELLAYADAHMKYSLHYWQRHAPGSSAEVDYLTVQNQTVLPVEVKSGAGSTLKSLHMFLQSHPKSPRGLRFSTRNYLDSGNICSLPLYAVASLAANKEVLLRMCT